MRCHCHFTLPGMPVLSVSQPERLRSEPIDQDTGCHRICQTEYDTDDPEHQRRHPQLHHPETDQICRGSNNPVCAAFQFCSGIIGLKQIINREIMHGEKHAHTYNRNKNHNIIHGILCSSRRVEQHGKSAADDHCGKKIDLRYFPQADAEQFQHHVRFLVERIGQKASVTVHKQRPGKSRPSVDGIHDKHKIRQKDKEYIVDLFLHFRFQIKDKQRPQKQHKTYEGYFLRGVPEDFPVAFDE